MQGMKTKISILALISLGFFPLTSVASLKAPCLPDRIKYAMPPDKYANPHDYRDLQFKCYRWRYICTGPYRCAKYSYEYNGCWRCYKNVLTKDGRYLTRQKVETCLYERLRSLRRYDWSCQQYYYSKNSAHTADQFCVRWTRNCKYVCNKWFKGYNDSR